MIYFKRANQWFFAHITTPNFFLKLLADEALGPAKVVSVNPVLPYVYASAVEVYLEFSYHPSIARLF